MFSVVIADDEPLIIKGLMKMVDWDCINTKVVGTCRNGEQLIRLIEELSPDIVISDISMPKQSGIDVVRYIKEKGLDSKVVFLSAYQEFEYAKQALTYGVIDYLLKPVTKDELESSIIKAERALEDNLSLEFIQEDKKSPQAVFKTLTSEYEFRDLYQKFEEMNMPAGKGFYIGVCFAVLNDARNSSGRNEFELLRFTVLKKIEEYIRKRNMGFCLKREAGFSNNILFCEKEKTDKVEMDIRDLIVSMREEYKVKLVAGIGKPVDKLSNLKFAYKTAAFACNIYYFKQDEIISFEQINKDYKKSFDDYNQAYQVLVRAIMVRDPLWKDKLLDSIRLIGELHFGNRSVAENRCVALLMELLRELNQYCQLEDSIRRQYEAFVSEIREMDTYQKVEASIVRYVEPFIEKNVYSGTGMKNDTIREIKLYIKEHYNKDINLKSMSNMFFMNQYYFSSFFKQKTGKNFKDYLVEVRMQKALAMLLENHEISIQMLAREVGYNDVKTFSEKFKQYYGESPVNYRKINRDK